MNERNGTAGSVTSTNARVVDLIGAGKVLNTHSKLTAVLLELLVYSDARSRLLSRACLP